MSQFEKIPRTRHPRQTPIEADAPTQRRAPCASVDRNRLPQVFYIYANSTEDCANQGTQARCGDRAGMKRIACSMRKGVIAMSRNVSIALLVAALVIVIVSFDILFFKNRFWERLLANIGIVMVFAAFGLRFFKK